MSLATLIERIAGKQKKRQEGRTADFRGIAVQIADGHEADADDVDRVLHDAGKTLDDLRQAVEKLQHRRQLRELWERLPAVAAERKEIEAKIAAADKALDEADTHHTEVTMPLHARLQELRDAGWAAESAKRDLWLTCEDPALKAQLAEVQVNLTTARQEAANLRTQLDNWKAQVRSDRALVEQAKRMVNGEKRVEEALARTKQHERKVGECEVPWQRPRRLSPAWNARRRRFGSRWCWHEPVAAFATPPWVDCSLTIYLCTESRRGWRPRWLE